MALDTDVFWRLANAQANAYGNIGAAGDKIANAFAQKRKDERDAMLRQQQRQQDIQDYMIKEQIKQETDPEYQYIRGVEAIQRGDATPDQRSFVSAMDATKSTALGYDPTTGSPYQRNRSIFDVIEGRPSDGVPMGAQNYAPAASPSMERKPARAGALPMPPAPSDMGALPTEDYVDIQPLPASNLYDNLSGEVGTRVLGTVNPDGSLTPEKAPAKNNLFDQLSAVGVQYPEATNPKEQSMIFMQKAAAAGDAEAKLAVKRAESILEKGKNNRKDTTQGFNLALTSKNLNKAIDTVSDISAGWGGALKYIPKTDARALSGYIDQITSGTVMQRLQEIKDQSPTGAAGGSVSDFETKIMAAALGSLDQFQDPEIVRENLKNIQRVHNRSMKNIYNAIKQDIANGLDMPPVALDFVQEYESLQNQTPAGTYQTSSGIKYEVAK